MSADDYAAIHELDLAESEARRENSERDAIEALEDLLGDIGACFQERGHCSNALGTTRTAKCSACSARAVLGKMKEARNG